MKRPLRPTPPPPRARTAAAAAAGDDEAAFLKRYDASAYPRPSVAVDVVALTLEQGALHAALVRRTAHPHKGRLALPGGFVRLDESLDAAARRVLAHKAGLSGVFLEQLYTFGDPKRDPRGRVITVAYYALVDAARFPRERDDLVMARLHVPWQGETGGPVDVLDAAGRALPFAFDHADIVGLAIKRLRGKLDYSPVGFQLLPPEFTLRQLQDVHEVVRGESVNKDSFRRRMLASGHLEATGDHEVDVTWRPAELYRFVRRSAL